MPSLSRIISENKVSTLLIPFHQRKGNVLVHSYSKINKSSTVIYFSVCDKGNMYGVKTVKIGFHSREIVNINQLV